MEIGDALRFVTRLRKWMEDIKCGASMVSQAELDGLLAPANRAREEHPHGPSPTMRESHLLVDLPLPGRYLIHLNEHRVFQAAQTHEAHACLQRHRVLPSRASSQLFVQLVKAVACLFRITSVNLLVFLAQFL